MQEPLGVTTAPGGCLSAEAAQGPFRPQGFSGRSEWVRRSRALGGTASGDAGGEEAEIVGEGAAVLGRQLQTEAPAMATY